jgi:hypothetical protein
MGCASKQSKVKTNVTYFEGKVTYSINYSSQYEDLSNEYLQNSYGSYMEMYFKNGNIYKKYYNPNGQLLSERYLILKDNKSYSKSINQDTIYWFDIKKHDTKQTFKSIEDSTILNEPALGIETKGVVSGIGFGENTYDVSGKFYFSKKYMVNPKWYENFREANYNEIIKFGKGIQLLLIETNPNWTKETSFNTITPMKVDEKIFNIDSDNEILKEL